MEPVNIIATLGAMQRYGVIVTAECRRCGARRRADLDKLIGHLGPEGSLIDRHPPCWKRACGGEVMFLASPGDGVAPSPCVTVAGAVSRWRREKDREDELKLLKDRR